MENNLSPRHRVAALLEARGEMNAREISEAVNLSYSRLAAVRAFPEYKLLVEKYQKELTERTLDEAAQLLAKFNKAAPGAFETLELLHTKADRDSVRLGAAKEILDRASVSPKKQEFRAGGDSGGITIQLGSQRMGMIIGALEDIGDTETIELLEGEDYITESSPEVEIIAKEAP